MQKTWKDLLGTDTKDAVIDGRFISRRIGPKQYRIIWDCQSPKMAKEIYRIWLQQVNNN